MKFAAAAWQSKWGQSKAVRIVAVPYELLISYSTKKERETEEKRGQLVEISRAYLLFLIMSFTKLKTQGGDEMVMVVGTCG